MSLPVGGGGMGCVLRSLWTQTSLWFYQATKSNTFADVLNTASVESWAVSLHQEQKSARSSLGGPEGSWNPVPQTTWEGETPNKDAEIEEKACLELWCDSRWQRHEGRSWVWDEGPQAGALIQKTHKGWWQCWVWSPVKRVQLHPHLARKLTSSYSDWELLFDVIISAVTTSSVIYQRFNPAVLENGVHWGCTTISETLIQSFQLSNVLRIS